MNDLASRMLRMRDEQGLAIDDAVIRQAAKGSIDSIESLDSRFRMAGLPQKNEVLRTLLKLRADAQKPVPPTAATNGRHSQPPIAAPSVTFPPMPASPAPAVEQPEWSPPSWYRIPEADLPAPELINPISSSRSAAAPRPPSSTPPAPTQAAPTPSAPTPSAPTQSAPTPSAPTQSAPTQSAPSQSAPTQSAPTQSAPTQSAPTQSVPVPQDPVLQQVSPTGPPAWYLRTHDADAAPTGSATSSDGDLPTVDPRSPTGPPAWYQRTHDADAAPTGSAVFGDGDLPTVDLMSPICDEFAAADGRLIVKADDDAVTVRWAPAPPDPGRTTVYLVCTAKAGIPGGPDQGRRVVATTNTTVRLTGTEQYFSVFAYSVEHWALLTTATCHRHALGRLLPEVEDLKVISEVHGILLAWRRPRGIDRVRVLRSLPDEELPDIQDKSLLLSFTGDSFRDESAEPGAVYQYKIYTESAGLGAAAGSTESSPGLVRTGKVPAVPSEISELVGSIVHRESDPGVTLSWQVPQRGHVEVYWSRREPSHETAVGIVLSRDQFAAQLELLGTKIDEPAVTVGDRQSLGWVPLAMRDQREDLEPQWTFTVVSEFDNQYVIGAHKVITYVGDIGEAEIDERVDFQLLRASWPEGASFLGVWFLSPGDELSGPPVRRVTRDEFNRYGGVYLQLPPQALDIGVQAATKYGAEWFTGTTRTVRYPGRWVVRYELPSKFGGTRSLQLKVDRPDWPGLALSLMSNEHGFPLLPSDPGTTVLFQTSLPGTELVPGQWVRASPDLRLPRHGHLRLFVSSAAEVTPVVIDPLPEIGRTVHEHPAPALRCPRCLVPDVGMESQVFRCEGRCPVEPDWPKTLLLRPGATSSPVMDRPVFIVSRPTEMVGKRLELTAPVDQAACPRIDCQGISHQQVCPHCHFTLPPNWWAHEVQGLVVVGARSSGKTTYLSVLVRHLEKNLLPLMRGYLHPVDDVSQAKLDVMRRGVDEGRLENSTVGAADNLALLDPMVADISESSGRSRSLAVFDVAGEDMAVAAKVLPYSPALSGADLVLILVDPLQLDGIREWLRGTVPLPPAEGTVPAATVVHNVVQQIRRQRGISGRLPIRAAVAFSKFDGLQKAAKERNSTFANLIGPGNALWRDPYAAGLPPVYDEADGLRVHEEVRALLHRVGETALISSVESSFAEVRYFAVSALGHGPRGQQLSSAGASPLRVGDPVRWLLSASGWA